MKKLFLLSVGLIMALSSLLVSCSDDNGVVICNISVSATENGSVAIENYTGNLAVVLAGNNVKLIATPDEGCEFVGWFVGDEQTPVSTDRIYTFVVSRDLSLIAKFTKSPVVSISSVGDGSVAFANSSDSSLPVVTGDEVTVIATPGEGCEFAGWFVGDSETPVSKDEVYTFTVKESVALVAKFNKCPVVSISCDGEGRVAFKNSTETSQSFLSGTVVTVFAYPDDDCDFVGWFVADSDTPISTNAAYTFVVSEDISLVAKFSKWPVVSIRSAGNGSVSFSDSSQPSKAVVPGTTVTVIAVPDENCNFVGWFAGDSETLVSTDATYTFTVSKSVALVAKFSQWPVVSIRSAGNGSVSFSDAPGAYKAVMPGTSVTVVAVPYEYCDFIGWFVGDSETPVSTEAAYTFTMGESISLVAKFRKWPMVSIRSVGGGSVSFSDSDETSQYVSSGTSITVVATPDEYSEFVGWFVGNSNIPVSTEASYTFTVSENVSLVAKFKKWPMISIRCNGYGRVAFSNSSESSQYVLPGTEVTVVATPDENCEFVGWFIGNDAAPVSTELVYTLTVVQNVSLLAKFKASINGYEWVDLGLPSGLKWAAYNVGANSPEEYGDYYAWGEVETKDDYSWATAKWCDGAINTMTKYCTDKKYGTVDNKTVLELADDVAHVKWAATWRIPTASEQQELINKCSWEWTTMNGVDGYKVVGPNGNSIFLPAAGLLAGSVAFNKGSTGYYSSSSLVEDNNNYAYGLYFKGTRDEERNYRYYGMPVRPVSE